MYTDVLCRIITETTYAHLHELVYKLHVILLEKRILCIYVRKTADSLMCALCTVIVVLDALETICMEHLLASADSLIELVSNEVDVEGSMIRKHVHKHTDIIFSGRIKHRSHLLLCSDYVVSDRPVGRLIIMIPVTFLLVKDLDVTTLRTETCVYW